MNRDSLVGGKSAGNKTAVSDRGHNCRSWLVAFPIVETCLVAQKISVREVKKPPASAATLRRTDHRRIPDWLRENPTRCAHSWPSVLVLRRECSNSTRW